MSETEPIPPSRPANATREAIRKCFRWLDACREIGWGEDQMDALESLFWQYHDNEGERKRKGQ